MNLYIDIGNSSIRMAIDQGGDLDMIQASFYRADTLATIVTGYSNRLPQPERVLIANVAGDQIAASLVDWCQSAWSIKPEFIQVRASCCGVTNAYSRPAQLGVDRWLAMVAAWNKYRGDLCVFDCGSAVTADLVSAGGLHSGGYIIPGVHMMQQALVHATGQIVLTQPYQFTDRPGHSTDECVYNGTTVAVAGFIEYLMQRLNEKSDSKYRCIITGGGADNVINLLRIEFDREPHLVIEGLRLVGQC